MRQYNILGPQAYDGTQSIMPVLQSNATAFVQWQTVLIHCCAGQCTLTDEKLDSNTITLNHKNESDFVTPTCGRRIDFIIIIMTVLGDHDYDQLCFC